MTDLRFMARALELAARGAGRTSPNPMVGAVVVQTARSWEKGGTNTMAVPTRR